MNEGLSDGIIVVSAPIALKQLQEIAGKRYGDLAKTVVDIRKRIMAVGGELHADEEALLLSRGSKQQDLWGINILVNKARDRWIEYDSMINIRPSQGNRSRTLESSDIRGKIADIINTLIK